MENLGKERADDLQASLEVDSEVTLSQDLPSHASPTDGNSSTQGIEKRLTDRLDVALKEMCEHMDNSLKNLGESFASLINARINGMEKRIALLESVVIKIRIDRPSWDMQPSRYLAGHRSPYGGSLLSLVPEDDSEQQDGHGSGGSSPELYDSEFTYTRSVNSYPHSTRHLALMRKQRNSKRCTWPI